MSQREVTEAPSAETFGFVGARLFFQDLQAAIAGRGIFNVALAGGTSPQAMHRALVEEPYRSEIDWTLVHVFFGDERCVPEGHADRNDRAAFETLLGNIPIPSENVHRVDPLLPDADERLEAELRRHFKSFVPEFDLIVLGMGPDGHTASLFPGRASLDEPFRLVLGIQDSPKPPPERITFTLPLINAARHVLVLAPGAEKRALVLQVLAGRTDVPIARLSPTNGRVEFLVEPDTPPESQPEPKSAIAEMA